MKKQFSDGGSSSENLNQIDLVVSFESRLQQKANFGRLRNCAGGLGVSRRNRKVETIINVITDLTKPLHYYLTVTLRDKNRLKDMAIHDWRL